MIQRTAEQASPRRSTLDRAIVVSIAAMALMNVLVLAEQMQITPLLAAAGNAAGAVFA